MRKLPKAIKVRADENVRCFACDAKLRKYRVVQAIDKAQNVWIGPECARHVFNAGITGWQPPKGGPRLIPLS